MAFFLVSFFDHILRWEAHYLTLFVAEGGRLQCWRPRAVTVATGAPFYWPVGVSTHLPKEVTERKDEGENATRLFHSINYSRLSCDSDDGACACHSFPPLLSSPLWSRTGSQFIGFILPTDCMRLLRRF